MGSALLKSIFSDYPKSLISRINEVYVFSIKYRCSAISFEKKDINFIYYRSFGCNHTCYCVSIVCVTPASRYVTSASRYQSRSSIYIRGMIPRNCMILQNWPRQFRLGLAIKISAMTRNDHNQRLQTNQRHREEQTQSTD